jgi:tRNA(Ile)-lysidine synthase
MNETLQLAKLGPAPDGGASAADSVRVARPLLRILRSTTSAYCAEFGLSVVEDASNLSRAYTRNRVRLDLLPALERFNPQIRAVLARTADLAAEDVAALDVICGALLGRLSRAGGYDLRLWRNQPRAIQRRLLRAGLELAVGDLADVRAAPIEDALDLLQFGTPGQTYHLPHGVELRIASESFRLDITGGAMARKGGPNNWGVEVARV